MASSEQQNAMSGTKWARAHYLDASALVKLVVDEGDCVALRSFFQENTNFCATFFCLIEALSVLKGKWGKKQLGTDAYFRAARSLVIDAWGKRIEIDDLQFLDPKLLTPVEELAGNHNLDLSDALQLITIKNGKNSVLGPNSASVLITADAKLAAAASAEGIRVWNCATEEVPEWI